MVLATDGGLMGSFPPADKPPPKTAAIVLIVATIVTFLILPLLCLGDAADARTRAAAAKVAFEIGDQPTLPDTPPNLNLGIKKNAGAAAFRPIDAACRIKVTAGDKTCYGSGVIVDAGVMTCSHLFTEPGTLVIEVECGDETAIGSILKRDAKKDIALLSCQWKVPKPAAKLAEKLPKKGDSLSSCGRGTTGCIDSMEHVVAGIWGYDAATEILFTPPPFLGRSGAGLFNASGELVGVIWAYDSENRGHAVSSLDVRLLIGESSPAKSTGKLTATVFTGEDVYGRGWCGNCRPLKSKWGAGSDRLVIEYSTAAAPGEQIYPAVRFRNEAGEWLFPARGNPPRYFTPELNELADIISRNSKPTP